MHRFSCFLMTHSSPPTPPHTHTHTYPQDTMVRRCGDTGGEACPKISKLFGWLTAAPPDKKWQGKLRFCWQAPGPFGITALAGEVVITLDC